MDIFEQQKFEKKITLVEEFFNIIREVDGFSAKRTESGIVFIPPKSQYFYMPQIVIKDLNRFSTALERYINVVKNTDIRSTKINEKHNIPYFLFCLIKNLSNYDCNNFEEYVERYTDFIEDKTFIEYNKKTKIGMLNEGNEVLVRRTEEYYGPETPYIFRTYIKNQHMEYELPIIRYGICNFQNHKQSYIHMIQRKKHYNGIEEAKKIDMLINRVNSGVKTMRDVPPSMVFVLSLFVGMLQSEGIYDIVAPDFLTRRYAHFKNVESEEQRNNIQFRATDKFLKIFLRIEEQLKGFNITAFPNDIDSSMHISAKKKLKSENELLNQVYLMGYERRIDINKGTER